MLIEHKGSYLAKPQRVLLVQLESLKLVRSRCIGLLLTMSKVVPGQLLFSDKGLRTLKP